MRMLVYRTAIGAQAPFDLDGVKEHLRVTHSEEDASISGMAWAAAAEVEHFAQVALLTQVIRLTIFDPTPGQCDLRLPIGPVPEGGAASVAVDGEAFTDFELVGGIRPTVRWLAKWHDLRPARVSIEYNAGFGNDATSIPRDLAQAVMDQAGVFFDGRSPLDAKTQANSPQLARIGARYRGVSM